MCGGAGQQQKNIQAANEGFSQTLRQAFQSRFGSQTDVLNKLNSTLQSTVGGGGAPDVNMNRERQIALSRALDRTTANYSNAARAVAGNLAGRGGDTGVQSGIDAQIKAALAGEAAKTLSGEQSDIELNTLEAGRDKYNRALAGMETLSGQYNPEQFGQLAGSIGGQAFDEAKQIDQQKGGVWKVLGGIAKAGISAGLGALTGGTSTMGLGAMKTMQSGIVGAAKNVAQGLDLSTIMRTPGELVSPY